jgi:hypothetical protein
MNAETVIMKFRKSIAVSLAALGYTCALAATTPAEPVGSDGMMRLQTRQLDEVYVRPEADFRAYRKVIIDPPQVEMRKGWLKSINATRGPSRWLVPEDVTNITDNAAVSLGTVVGDSFVARGYEVVTAPGAGVLRVSARVTDMVVSAPDVASAYQQALFSVDAGEATLILEVRDAATGTLLGRVVDRGTAHELSSRINRTFAVTNVFWFDALFRQWATNCIQELTAASALR